MPTNWTGDRSPSKGPRTPLPRTANFTLMTVHTYPDPNPRPDEDRSGECCAALPLAQRPVVAQRMSSFQKDITVDPARPFTLYEVCPRCNEASPPARVGPPSVCARCNDTGGRTERFKTRGELLAYVASLPTWPG